MTIAEQIEKEYIEAYKNKNKVKLDTLRLVKSAAKNRQVELLQTNTPLPNEEYLSVLLRQVKQRQESIELYTNANRTDLAANEQAELDVLRTYLPKQLSQEEIDVIIKEAVAPHLSEGMKAMGKIIQSIMEKYKGQIDGKAVSEAVKAKLQNGS